VLSTFILSCSVRDEFQQKLMQAHRQTIAPVVVWLLESQEKHKHRIYLARYLLKIEIPPEVLSQDDFLQTQHAQYLELMTTFKDVYKSHKEATAGLEDPVPLEARLQQMEEETDTLEGQVEEMRHKIESIVCCLHCTAFFHFLSSSFFSSRAMKSSLLLRLNTEKR
jgi:intraflagellar transport protein 81